MQTLEKITYSSENYSARKKGAVIDTIIIHHTATHDLETALKLLTQKQYQVSSHYVVDRDGTIYSLVDEDKKAWHAGVSNWRGREGINDYSIGIELLNNGFEKFPAKQIDALILLCKDIMQRHEIDQRNVIGHFDIAPNRKIDPNHFFDWKKLFENGLGVYSDVSVDNIEVLHSFGDKSEDLCNVKTKLSDFGYNINVDSSYDTSFNAVAVAFKRHYSIESYEITGWDSLADARLNDLVEHYV